MPQHHRFRLHASWLLIVSLLLAGGCKVGPNYHPPKYPVVPTHWVGQGTTPATPEMEKNLVQWWTIFHDPKLDSLIQRAVKANLDLKLADARIAQAQAARAVAEAGLWPQFSFGASYLRSRTPAQITTGGTTGAGGTGTGTGAGTGKVRTITVGVMSTMYKAALAVTWPIDLFGGIRRNIEAAQADLQTAEENRRDQLVLLTSEVAQNYLNLRGFQQQVAIAQKNLVSQQHTVDVTRQRYQGGFVGALDVANAQALAATTASQIPTLQTSARQSIYALSVLLGVAPEALVTELSPTGPIPPAPPKVPTGVPSELLRRRPDIRSAAEQIHGATARIGVAEADLYPQLTLNGSLGTQGSEVKNLWNWINRDWQVQPMVNLPILQGALINNVKVQKALRDQSILTYEKTVLTALQDVENALIASTKEQERRRSLADAVEANRKAVDYSNQLYAEGQTDFLSVLDAERSLYSSEDSLVQSNRAVSVDLVQLFQALGGGWQ